MQTRTQNRPPPQGDEPEMETPDDRAISAMARLPTELAVVKMENESIMAMAAAKPLDYRVVLADLKAQLEVSPAFAEEAIYEKPVGSDTGGQMKYARGLSIYAAEAIANSMGFYRTRRSVMPLDGDPDKVTVTCSFTNFRNGSVSEIQKIVSRKYTTRNKAVAYHPEDRFFDVVIPSSQSKAMREAILRSMPPAIRLELERMVEETLESFLDEATVNKLLGYFSSLKVTKELLESYIGKHLDAFTQADRARLLAVSNGIKQGETTVDDVFGEKPTPTEAKADAIKEKLKRPAPPTAPTPTAEAKAPETPPATAKDLSEKPAAPSDPPPPTEADLQHEAKSGEWLAYFLDMVPTVQNQTELSELEGEFREKRSQKVLLDPHVLEIGKLFAGAKKKFSKAVP